MTEGLNTPDDQPQFTNWIDETEAKIEEARAIIKEMVEWFNGHYEDPAAHTPYCTEEGGYQWRDGGPFNAHEEIGCSFLQREGFSEDEWDVIVSLAVEGVEEDGITDWALVVDDIEPGPEPGIHLIHARDHQWGKGHVHVFDVVRGVTLCGRPRQRCPGARYFADAAEVTCASCKHALERRARP